MEIKQVYFSSAIRFFQQGFCDYWSVEPYHDKEEPAIFFGMYNDRDVEAINSHNGFKVLCHTGRAMPAIKKVIAKDVILKLSPMNIEEYRVDPNEYNKCINVAFKTKKAMFPIKDFSMFKPNELGENIYCYLGSEGRKKILGYGMVKKLERHTKHKIMIGFLGGTIEDTKVNYYDKCFINFKPSITAGITSAIELGYMGRYTISNLNAPFCKGYKNFEAIMEHIERESKKIGTIQNSLVDGYFNTGSEWKKVDFWQ